MKCAKLIYVIWIFYMMKGSSMVQSWGEDCPSECKCSFYEMSQTLMARWEHAKGKVKLAMCVIEMKNLESLTDLPNDTEAFTFLQATDSANTTLDGDATRTLQNVKIMDIQGSPGKGHLQIMDDSFHDKQSLKYLYLQKVDLRTANKVFSKLHSLEVLRIVNCNLAVLKWEMLDGLSALKELYLVQNGIKELFDFAFYGTPELRRLFLSHNELFSVDADNLVGLLKLEHLDLSNNNIDHLSGLTFPPMPHLQWLELKHNPIRVIFPHCFQFLNGTQHLTLGHKHQAVHLMKFSFRGLFSLIYLHIPNIDNDVLSEHMFYDLQSLLHLNLQGRVKVVNARAFIGAHKMLQKLVLQGCEAERIMPDAFHGLQKLKTLDLSKNKLTYLPENLFSPLESIQELLLNNNLLKSLSKEMFHDLKGLKALRLNANPWNCNCNMSMWDENMVIKVAQVTSTNCTRKSKPHCKEHKTLYTDDFSLIPKCEHPLVHHDQSVFEVLKTHWNCSDDHET